MNKKIQINKLKYLSLALLLSTSLGVTGCSNSKKSNFNDTFYGVYDNTCFDELVDEDFISLICELEDYINISDEIHKLKLADITCIDDYKDSNMLSVRDINSLISDYKNNNFSFKSKDDVVRELYVQNKLVNNFIYDNGYSIMAKATLYGLKARIGDLAGLSLNDTRSLVVMDRSAFDDCMSDVFRDVYIGDYDVGHCNDFTNLMFSIYDMQSNEAKVKNNSNYSGVVYNEERNKLLLNAIERLNVILSSDYVIDGKKRIKKI